MNYMSPEQAMNSKAVAASSDVPEARKESERLAAEQGVRPIIDLDSLRADFWPEDERVDAFLRTVRERRHIGGEAHPD